MMQLRALILEFLQELEHGAAEVYNEFSLQHELGIFLRRRLPDMKVQFERNVSYFHLDKQKFVKREIDISIFPAGSKNLTYTIELKYPRNGQHPEQMFSFCKDIRFTEQLVSSGSRGGFVLILVEDDKFYQGPAVDGIYSYFRDGKPVNGPIMKPTGKKDERLVVEGSYLVKWEPLGPRTKYALIPVASSTNAWN